MTLLPWKVLCSLTAICLCYINFFRRTTLFHAKTLEATSLHQQFAKIAVFALIKTFSRLCSILQNELS